MKDIQTATRILLKVLTPVINTYMNIKSKLNQQYEIPHELEVRVVEDLLQQMHGPGVSVHHQSNSAVMSVRLQCP